MEDNIANPFTVVGFSFNSLKYYLPAPHISAYQLLNGAVVVVFLNILFFHKLDIIVQV